MEITSYQILGFAFPRFLLCVMNMLKDTLIQKIVVSCLLLLNSLMQHNSIVLVLLL